MQVSLSTNFIDEITNKLKNYHQYMNDMNIKGVILVYNSQQHHLNITGFMFSCRGVADGTSLVTVKGTHRINCGGAMTEFDLLANKTDKFLIMNVVNQQTNVMSAVA